MQAVGGVSCTAAQVKHGGAGVQAVYALFWGLAPCSADTMWLTARSAYALGELISVQHESSKRCL